MLVIVVWGVDVAQDTHATVQYLSHLNFLTPDFFMTVSG